jgi:hypothetical protein
MAFSVFAPSAGRQMYADYHLFGRDPAWLLSIRARIAVEKTRRELLQRGHLLLGLGHTVPQQMPLTIFAPSAESRISVRYDKGYMSSIESQPRAHIIDQTAGLSPLEQLQSGDFSSDGSTKLPGSRVGGGKNVQ